MHRRRKMVKVGRQWIQSRVQCVKNFQPYPLFIETKLYFGAWPLLPVFARVSFSWLCEAGGKSTRTDFVATYS